MATVDVNVTATALSENSPNSVIDITFNYGETTEQNGTVIYYGALLTDGTDSEYVLFPLTVTPGTNIPASSEFAYTPTVAFTGTVTGSQGKVYYTP
ncbi:MAG TPA: hypothetical protein GX499_00240 [Clostridiales bacterium]|jgi:hypothetical protein|nr:hypothetical protein [Clostridiales bacterium]